MRAMGIWRFDAVSAQLERNMWASHAHQPFSRADCSVTSTIYQTNVDPENRTSQEESSFPTRIMAGSVFVRGMMVIEVHGNSSASPNSSYDWLICLHRIVAFPKAISVTIGGHTTLLRKCWVSTESTLSTATVAAWAVMACSLLLGDAGTCEGQRPACRDEVSLATRWWTGHIGWLPFSGLGFTQWNQDRTG